MTLDNELKNLKKSFHAVAVATEKELPTVWNKAINVWQNEQDAVLFLCRPHGALGGKTPLKTAQTSEEGQKRVIDLLGRLQHGIS